MSTTGRHGYGKDRFIGPRCAPHGTLPDEYGIPTFVDYRRACKADGCMVRLTSDTRAGALLLCIEHGKAYEREKAARLRAARTRKAAPSRPAPSNALKAKADDRELRALLQRAIPPVWRRIGLYRDAAHEAEVRLRAAREAGNDELAADLELKARLIEAIDANTDRELKARLIEAIDAAAPAVEHVPEGSLDLGLSVFEFNALADELGV